ncbi:DUF6239 family natural product biosynthesis protein [Actinophytocola gossypii]|uniref:Uncharacterized protein n=1 Tax=Actinophytocola gossypii TaxID=2812003 RepID=A0ABT2J7F3_9PSEU|nr:DUF6239 family natural product biosynthesis protein [Actinophytocola gossypii]MCT2583728.1 hypothetical protein [Actinophytocola gossypii]
MAPGLLIAQGHDHVLTVGISIGPLALRVALLVVVPLVAAFTVLRGFIGPPDRRTAAGVVCAAGTAVVLELLLAGGLGLPRQVVPLLLLGLAAPLYLVLSRDPRFAPAVRLSRRLAPWVYWPVAVLASSWFWRGFTADGDGALLLHTGAILALVALAWFVVAGPRWRPAVAALRIGAGALAVVLLAATAQATVLREDGPVPGAVRGAPSGATP